MYFDPYSEFLKSKDRVLECISYVTHSPSTCNSYMELILLDKYFVNSLHPSKLRDKAIK